MGRRWGLATAAAVVTVVLAFSGFTQWAMADAGLHDVGLPRVTGAPAESPVRTKIRATRVENGPLWSGGSQRGAGRHVVTLRTLEDLTTLNLTVRIAPADELSLGQVTTTVPGNRVVISAETQDDALLYHLALRHEHVLPAGGYDITVRFGGAAKDRDAVGDTYEVYADASRPLHVYGDFLPTGTDPSRQS
ncbi:hypothetical protein KOI35_36625 [Actinoplanes bogorensis]|uniref:Uncharacterized protein n=1 Tax=Paractinoplanes bogorensis TaxID=1610840 RepID=A0ABS5Z046_9ACTN|nr:hypothetical protein [Actinoplanes bogorensis]MBU2669052.1 hypothetical protein [Actinoplanes bogorensis]